MQGLDAAIEAWRELDPEERVAILRSDLEALDLAWRASDGMQRAALMARQIEELRQEYARNAEVVDACMTLAEVMTWRTEEVW